LGIIAHEKKLPDAKQGLGPAHCGPLFCGIFTRVDGPFIDYLPIKNGQVLIVLELYEISRG
jgi:hypothetical protein